MRRWRTWIHVLACSAGLFAGWFWSSDQRLAAARRAFKRQDWSVALTEAEVALRQKPGDPATLRLIARILQRLGRLTEAEALFDRWPVTDLATDELLDRGEGLLALESWPKAADVYQELTRRRPRDALLLKRLAVIQFQLGMSEPALASAQRLADFPEHKAASLCIQGVVYESQNRPDVAASFFQQVLELDPTGASLPVPLQQIVRKLTSALITLGRFDEAAGYLVTAVARKPDAHLLGELADVYAAQGKLDESRKRYVQALQLDNQNVAAFVGLGRLALAENQPREAHGWFEHALANGGKSAALHFQMSRALILCNRPDLAAEHLEESRRLRNAAESDQREQYLIADQPDSHHARFLLARQAIRAGAWNQAEQYLQDLERQLPGDPQVAHLRAQLERQRGPN